jgi:YVTN family beta-propeller protein
MITLLIAAVLAAGPAPGTLLVLNKSEATLSLLDLESGEVRGTVPTGTGPHEVAVSADGKTAVATDYGQREGGHTLTVVDVPGRRVLRTIDLGTHRRPHGIQFLPKGGAVAVTTEGSGRLLVVGLDPGAVTTDIATEARVTHMVVLAPDGRRAYTANIGSGSASVLDLEAGKLVRNVKTGAGAEGIDVSPDGTVLAVTNREADTVAFVDTATLEVQARVPCASFPIRCKFTPKGDRLLVSCAKSGEVAVLDAATRKETGRIALREKAAEDQEGRMFGGLGDGPVPVGLLIPPDGTRAFVACTNADVVVELDLGSLTVRRRLKAGKEPDGLGWSPLRLEK